jgi:diguanylate cyclase (GGDEF)-like protein
MIDMKFIVLNIFVPIIGAGIIFSGLILFIYVFINWKNWLYFSMSLIGAISFTFVLMEGFIATYAYILDNQILSYQFHRIEQLVALLYFVAIPMLFTYYLDLKGKFKKLNITIGIFGLLCAIVLSIVAFIKPDLYISVIKGVSRSPGRGQEGLLYRLRDIYLGVIIFYYFIVTIIHLIKNRKHLNQTIYILIGIIIAIFSALDDTIYINFNFHIGMFPHTSYPRFVFGIIFLTVLSMIGISKRFLDQSKKVAIAYDELDKSNEKLTYIAYHDQLTSLMNRKAFYERFEDSLIQAKRGDIYKMRGLLFIDLDNFKDINDAIGYNFGDEILKEVTIRIKSALRESDYIFRFGGDEFTVILNSLIDDADAAIVAQRIINNVSKPFDLKNKNFYLGISIGITLFPQDGLDVNTLVKNADTALNEAKKEQNVYKYYTKSMEIKAIKKVNLITDMRLALERNEFMLYYQPIQNLNNRVIGAEALIRWKHPTQGIIPPASFIPVAEESLLIIPIGQWILEKACEDLKNIHKMGFNDLFFSINLSIKQFNEAQFVENIKSIIAKTGIDPEFIHLEITESCLMKNIDETLDKLNSLRKIGIKFAIDDFGTGYSSFSYLESLPINTLKIEKCFISPIPDEKANSPLIEAIILLARKLGLEVISEGVETINQIDYLKSVDPEIIIQGYYFSKPLQYDDFIDYLKKNK